MLYGKFIDELADRLKIVTADTAVRSLLGRKINEAYKDIAKVYDWEYLKFTSEMVTVANITSGTVSITQNSNTVTGSGFTSAMIGRYFNPGGSTPPSSNQYRIVDVPISTQLTLQLPIVEATQSGITYTIWKRFYYLHSAVRKVLDFTDWLSNGPFVAKSNQWQMDNSNNIASTGVPLTFSVYGINSYADTPYSNGTVSASQDSQILTGVGTSWLTNDPSVEPGDLIIIGGIAGSEFRVKRVISDTSILLTQYVSSVITNSSYTIAKDNPLGIQFYPSPDKAYVFPYTYIKRVYSMINENYDRPELPEEFDAAILDGAETARLREMNDPKWTVKAQEYVDRVNSLKVKSGFLSQPRYRQYSPIIMNRSGY